MYASPGPNELSQNRNVHKVYLYKSNFFRKSFKGAIKSYKYRPLTQSCYNGATLYAIPGNIVYV